MQRNTLFWLSLLLLAGLQGCSTVTTVKPSQSYDLSSKNYLYNLKSWSFQGRVAVKSTADSWSAAISWTHQEGEDVLKLTGPLGQGAVLIKITEHQIMIDQGDGLVDHSADADQLIKDNLGVFVPVQALKYWVLGLTQPDVNFENSDTGFNQSGWVVNYSLYMDVGSELMPHKMKVYKDEAQLKLVFDQWQLNGS